MMKISTVTSVFVNYLLEDAVPQIAAAGCTGIDVWSGRPHMYRQDYSTTQLRDLKRQLDDHHLKVVSVLPAFFRYPHSLSSPNEIVRQDSLTYMRYCLDNAVTLGAEILLIVPGRTLYKQSLEDALARLTDSIDVVSRWAADYPIKVGIEPANASATDLVLTSVDALNIIDQLQYPQLGVVMDTGHLNLTGEPLDDVLNGLGEKLLQFHINDNDGKHQQNAIPGNGTFDFQGFIELLRKHHYDGYLSLELGFDYTREPIPALQTSTQRMQEWLASA